MGPLPVAHDSPGVAPHVVRSTNVPPEQSAPTWAMLEGQAVRLMVLQSPSAVTAAEEGVLFYLYYDDVEEAHRTASEMNLHPSPLQHPFYCPRGEFR